MNIIIKIFHILISFFENTKSEFCTIVQEYYFFHFTIVK